MRASHGRGPSPATPRPPPARPRPPHRLDTPGSRVLIGSGRSPTSLGGGWFWSVVVVIPRRAHGGSGVDPTRNEAQWDRSPVSPWLQPFSYSADLRDTPAFLPLARLFSPLHLLALNRKKKKTKNEKTWLLILISLRLYVTWDSDFKEERLGEGRKQVRKGRFVGKWAEI